MSEIKAKRWRLNGQTSIPHLFEGDSTTALCGAPRKARDSTDRVWEDAANVRCWDICPPCMAAKRARERADAH